MYVVCRQVLAVAVGVVCLSAQGDVTSLSIQLPVYLQHSSQVLAVGVCCRTAQLTVQDIYSVPRLAVLSVVAVVGRIAEGRSEEDVCHCVGLPLYLET